MAIMSFALDQKSRDAFVEGKIVIDCLDIQLTRNDAGDSTSFACAGTLLATPEHGINGRLVIARSGTQLYDKFTSVFKEMQLRSGQLMPPSRYFELKAQDIAGNEWTNPSASVEIEELPNAFIVKVSCNSLRCESNVVGSANSTHMVFMDELRFPDGRIRSQGIPEGGSNQVRMDSGMSEGEVAGMHLIYDPHLDRPAAKYVELLATSQLGAVCPENFDDRLMEAIRFCTATISEPVMRETIHGGKKVIELAIHRPANKGMLEPPLLPRRNSADFYHLMERYFHYACANAHGRDYAPLSAKIGGLFALKGVNLDTVALLVSVAVESVLNEDAFKGLGKPKTGVLDQLNAMLQHIRSSGIEQNFVHRVCSALGGIKSSRVKDKLHALVVASALDEADKMAWDDTRNKAAHGSFEIDFAKLQELIDVVFRLAALVYKLIFLQIGYKGKFTDYGVHGWPERNFIADLALISLAAEPTASSGPAPEPPTTAAGPGCVKT